MATTHSVQITHAFESAAGPSVVVTVDQASNAIWIALRFAKHANTIQLLPQDLGRVIELLDALGSYSAIAKESARILRQAGEVVGVVGL
jgi:hypothetical protein